MTGRETDPGAGEPEPASPEPANVAPDAVKDPNEKTEGKPGLGPQVGAQADEADPGGS